MTPGDLEVALVYSLNARRGVPAGRTWRDFQTAMAQLGVQDSDEISSIEYGVAQDGTGLLIREAERDGQINIKEKLR